MIRAIALWGALACAALGCGREEVEIVSDRADAGGEDGGIGDAGPIPIPGLRSIAGEPRTERSDGTVSMDVMLSDEELRPCGGERSCADVADDDGDGLADHGCID